MQIRRYLADSIDLTNNTIEGGTAALRANTEAWQENAKAQAYQNYLAEMYKQEAALQMEREKNKVHLTKAEIQLEQAQQKHNNATQRMNELYGEAEEKAAKYRQETGDIADVTSFLTQEYYDLENSLSSISDEITIAKENIKNHEKAIADDEEALIAYQSEVAETEEAIKSMTGSLDEGTGLSEKAAAQMQGFQSVMDDAGASLLRLAERYSEAYTAAYESISGQYSLWEQAANVETVSAANINSALESQIAYWKKYDANIDSLIARTSEIDGLSEMISSFADGSADSVNAIAGMAKANDSDLKKMVENWKKLQEEQKTASDSLAQLKEDFRNELDEILADTQSTIEEMNLSEEARESAEAIMQAFARAAKDQLPAVESAFSAVAESAMASFNRALNNRPSITGTLSAGLANMKASLSMVPGYASGTPDAPPGWAWVGEEGPELLHLSGGETILPADISAQFTEPKSTAISVTPLYAVSNNSGGGGVNVSINFSPTNQVTGQSDTRGLEGLLRNMTFEEGEKFAERVMDVITEWQRNHELEVFR